MPYIKVPYSNKKSPEGYVLDGSVEEVHAALPAGIDGLEVNDHLRFPSVNFPDGTPHATMKQVADHLRGQGFEVDL